MDIALFYPPLINDYLTALFEIPTGTTIDAQRFQLFPLRLCGDLLGYRQQANAVSNRTQPPQKYLVAVVADNVVAKGAIYLDVIQPKVVKRASMSHIGADMLYADFAAQRF